MKKKVLVITVGYPHPRRGASTVLYYWYLAALRQSDFEVDHLLLVDSDEVSAQAEAEYLAAIVPSEYFRVNVFDVYRVREVRRSGLSLHACELPDEIRAHVRSLQPDATVCFDILAADMARKMRLNRLLIWLGDLSFQTGFYHAYYDFKSAPSKFPGLVRAMLAGLLWKRCYRTVLGDQPHVIVSSHSSVERLARFGVPSRYWPYPWPGESMASAERPKHGKPTFIMYGTLVALGSRSAFDFLLNSVYPRLIQLWGSKGFAIRISGMRQLPSWVQAAIAHRPEFEFLGFVDDLAAEVARCHAVIAPISVPVGNRSRIVTAMSMGALVIAHANTALGNPELVSGDNCLLARTAQQFVDNMRLAHADSTVAARIGATARETYLKSFEPKVASKRLIEALRSMLQTS